MNCLSVFYNANVELLMTQHIFRSDLSKINIKKRYQGIIMYLDYDYCNDGMITRCKYLEELFSFFRCSANEELVL